MPTWMNALLVFLALPEFGLSTLFIIAFLSATLLPLGSEPALFGLLKLNPALFWQGIMVATAGNTLGGALSWWMGQGANKLANKNSIAVQHGSALRWLQKWGPKACLFSWLPIIGDPLCAVAGWLRMPFWPCFFYMGIGKFLRYLCLTTLLLYVFPST